MQKPTEITPLDGKAVYSQNLSMTIHLEEDLKVELVKFHKKESSKVLPFSKYASLYLRQGNPEEKTTYTCALIENQLNFISYLYPRKYFSGHLDKRSMYSGE